MINGTSPGKGERTSNAPLEGVLMYLVGMGYFADTKPDFTALNELVDLYETMEQGVPASTHCSGEMRRIGRGQGFTPTG